MKIAEIEYLGGLSTDSVHIRSGKHVATDAPPDNQGKGEAFSPTDLLCNALAACMFTLMGIAAQNHGFAFESGKADIEKYMLDKPRRVGRIAIRFSLPENLTVKQRAIVEAAARTCPVALSIHPEIVQEVLFTYR